MLEINQPGATPLTTSALRADERVVNYLKGLNLLDDRLAPLLAPFDVGGNNQTALPPSQQAVVETIVNQLRQKRPGTRPPTIQLVGPDPVSKQWVASRVGAELGLQLSRLPAELLPSQAAELETLARLWEREGTLLRIALYLDAFEGTEGQAEAQTPLYRFLARSNGLMFLDTREIRPALGHNSLAFDVDKPTPAEQQVAWSEALGSAADDSPGRLAGQFNLNLPIIQQIAQTVLAETSAEPTAPPLRDRVWETCSSEPAPGSTAWRSESMPRRPGMSLVLPAEPRALLRQIADQVGQRAKVYDEWGFRRTHEPRAGHQRAVCRRKRHRQDHGGGGDRQRAAAQPLPHRPLGRGQQVHRRDRKESAPAVRRRRGRRRDLCSSTRPTRCSASAARSRTVTTATPTSRSTTCCSGWRPTAAWRSWPRT